MESDKNASWVGTAGRRSLIVVVLIAVLVPFWLYLAFYTNLPTLVLAGVALLSLLLLSVATAWTAIAIPKRDSTGQTQQRQQK